MGLTHQVQKIERRMGTSAQQRSRAQRRSLDLIAQLQRDHVRRHPEYRQVTRGDCPDDESWNEVQETLAMADGDYNEAGRLHAFPAPRRAARQAWINGAPTVIGTIQRIGERVGHTAVADALTRTRARLAHQGTAP